MQVRTPLLTLSSRELRLPAAQVPGALTRPGAMRCRAVPVEKKKDQMNSPTQEVIHITVHIHTGGGMPRRLRRRQAVEWNAVALSPEAKALLQRHGVKATAFTVLKIRDALGRSGDPVDLQQQGGSQQHDGSSQSQDKQQLAGQAPAAGHAGARPSPGTLPAAGVALLPAAVTGSRLDGQELELCSRTTASGGRTPQLAAAAAAPSRGRQAAQGQGFGISEWLRGIMLLSLVALIAQVIWLICLDPDVGVKTLACTLLIFSCMRLALSA